MTDQPSITCPVCGMTSHHPRDVSEGYCGACHEWTGAVASLVGKDDAYGFGRGRALFHDRQGHPLTLARWTWLYERTCGDPDYRRVAYDDVPEAGVAVSTVWEGNSISPFGPPMIFETAIIDTPDDSPGWLPRVIAQERYSTETEAIASHATLVRSLRMVGRSFLDELIDDEPEGMLAGIVVVMSAGAAEAAARGAAALLDWLAAPEPDGDEPEDGG